MTPKREARINAVLDHRQPTLQVVIENVDDPHNIGAILRSCDAFGIIDVHFLYTNKKQPRLGELRSKAAASTLKWLRINRWDSVAKLKAHLKKQKISLLVTSLGAKSKDPAKLDLTKPVAFAFGNEHSGSSKELMKAADAIVRLPMVGFVESFNVSVAAAISLHEAYRQRSAAGLYDKPQLSKLGRARLLKHWLG